MPRRAPPGRRDRIEGALSPRLRDALGELCELLDVHDWARSPLAPPFTAAAAVLLAADLVRDGMAGSTALDAAADHLGLERGTVRSWLRRWPAASRGYVHNARAGSGSTPVGLILDAACGTPLPEEDEA
jgi:hypothetical protein